MTSNNNRLCALGTLLMVCAASIAIAQDEPPMMVKSQSGVPLDASVDWNMCRDDGVAIGGYDPVSYRQPDGPVAGNADYSTDHDGATYRFANAANLETFLADPDRYVPAYSGFCAVTLALGRVTCPDYTNFQIEDDRLLLFETTGFTNGRTLWNTDAPRFRHQANGNFDLLNDSQ